MTATEDHITINTEFRLDMNRGVLIRCFPFLMEVILSI